jgi:hypothetical protein
MRSAEGMIPLSRPTEDEISPPNQETTTGADRPEESVITNERNVTAILVETNCGPWQVWARGQHILVTSNIQPPNDNSTFLGSNRPKDYVNGDTLHAMPGENVHNLNDKWTARGGGDYPSPKICSPNNLSTTESMDMQYRSRATERNKQGICREHCGQHR